MGETPATLPDDFNATTQDTDRAGEVISVSEVKRPADLQAHLDNVSNGTIEVLSVERKIDDVFRKLEEKFGQDFDRSKFNIRLCVLEPNEIELLGFEVYTLWDKSKNKILAFINANGETLFEMKNFKPFINDFYKTLDNKVGLDYKQDKEGRWTMIWKGKEYPEGTEYFDRGVIATNILKLD